MRILTCAAAAVVAGLLVASPGTAGKGGRRPIRCSVGTASSARAAVSATSPFRRGTTTVAGVRIGDGRVLRFATVSGPLGIPQVTWDGTTDGISANGEASCSPRSRAGRSAAEPPSSSCGRNPSGCSGGSSSRAIGCSTDFTRRLDDLRRPVRRPVALQGSRHRHGHRPRARGAGRRHARARRGDARLADGPGLGPGRAWAYTLYASPTARRSSTRSTRSTAKRSASLPWTTLGDGIGKVRLEVSADGRGSSCASPARDACHDRP